MSVKLASKILAKLGVDPLDVIRHRYNLKNDKAVVEEIADILNVKTNPVKEIVELEDSPDKCYVWIVDATDEQTVELQHQAEKAFVKKYNRDPQSLHFIRNDLQGIEELEPSVVRERVEPWLSDNQ